VPDDARVTLAQLRLTIKATAPDAVESISYGMPTFKYQGRPLIYFAAARNHCALYGTSRGTIRFPPNEPPSAALVRSLVRTRIENIEAAAAGRKRKQSGAKSSA
jgi:uncharacterized protein YdhG (YjbR/CyaY superfamily)